MPSRRGFLLTSALAAGAGAVPTGVAAERKRRASTDDPRDWGAVRRQFDLEPRYIHLGLFFLASRPRPVREAIASYRQQLEANPLHTVGVWCSAGRRTTSRRRCATPSPRTSAGAPMTSR